ncbi:hypothetical protein J5N97_002890 [Dioscorea zingiberensis]|uniref:Hexosyltransferase n=1 Tax=Dioscorea zingiberensis TaxID=325984 RepID=A0A9D5D4T2_9LILI|nr:hypothetical protein J5N97_002890 [Dioscorea zingiberensis]
MPHEEGKIEDGVSLKMVGDMSLGKERVPSFMDEFKDKNLSIGLVNIREDEVDEWRRAGNVSQVYFDRVSENFEWKDLFPEFIDEEEEMEGPTCPEIPMPEFSNYSKFDLVVARLPCRRPVNGWARDVFRLQVHLIVLNLATKKTARGNNGKVKVVLLSHCEPMIEIFRCDYLVKQEEKWRMYEVVAKELEEKLAMPIGSCKLAMPLWGEGTNQVYDLSKFNTAANPGRREAYATVLHSKDDYVCGAIILAQSLLKTSTTRDLILLHDKSISEEKLNALKAAGWKLREITRIRNPRAEKDSYNEYNYSKFRLWQLTYYHKIVFIDADIIVLRNLDLLFYFPEMSATGNDGSIFNSGIMVIKPSTCTFKSLMGKRNEIISYNGGDQGFLNEVFVWWHRLPRRVNFLKNFWANTTLEANMKNSLFSADPPKLYSIHYLGLKPWLCYRDYDCNWNIDDQRVYASDIAHWRWWKLHDQMDLGLQKFCGLSERRKIELAWDRKMAEKVHYPDEHWKINITDRRKYE